MNEQTTEAPPFSVSTKAELSEVLSVAPGEIGHIISRIEHYYDAESIPKASGGTRVLHKPRGRLRHVQRRIKATILDLVPHLPYVHGGVRGRSITSNARPHVGKKVILAVDIKDCFPTIGPGMVLKVFNELGITGQAARTLTALTTFERQLPQGTCTSPALANLALRRVDHRLSALAKQHGFSYTRFVDDIVLSGSGRLRKFRGLVRRILACEGFELKPKREVMLQSEPQVITKLVVNAKVNVPRERRASIRKEILQSTRDVRQELPPSTRGRLVWLKSINNEVGSRLLERFGSGAN